MGSKTRCTRWTTPRGAAAAAPSSERRCWERSTMTAAITQRPPAPAGTGDAPGPSHCTGVGLQTKWRRGGKPRCLSLQITCISEPGPAPGLPPGAGSGLWVKISPGGRFPFLLQCCIIKVMHIDSDIFSPAMQFMTGAFRSPFYLSVFLSYDIIYNDIFQNLSN